VEETLCVFHTYNCALLSKVAYVQDVSEQNELREYCHNTLIMLLWFRAFEENCCGKYSGYKIEKGHAVAQLVEALRYEPEGREYDSRWYHSNFSLT